MWVTRWEFVSRLERFGSQPADELLAHESLVVALVPLVDPMMPELDRSRIALSVPSAGLIEAARTRFENYERLTPSVLEDIFADPENWPPVGDWLVLSCREDGSARFGISPFVFVADVLNAREACAAVSRELGD